MSLTHILKSKDHKALRDKIKTDFPRPKIILSGELKAPPLTKNYGIVGTAFDYLLRFKLERDFPAKVKSDKQWIADLAIESIKTRARYEKVSASEIGYDGTDKPTKKEMEDTAAIMTMMNKMMAERMNGYYSKAIDLYHNAKDAHKNFIAGGEFSEDLANGVLTLAKLDLYVRRGILEDTIGENDQKDIDDLVNLYTIIPEKEFIPKSECYLNPTFGEGSGMFGGADADFTIDDILVDIKTTKNLEIKRVQLNQLLCYYLASRIGGINGNTEKRNTIKKVGIYFSRHGFLWTINLEEFGDNDKFNQFEAWLTQYFKKRREKLKTLLKRMN